MTDLAEERAAQEIWRARSRGGDLSPFDRFLENEFSSPEEQRARVSRALADMFRFAAREVPYYREALRFSVANPDGLETLSSLNILSKHDVQSQAAALCARNLPPDQQLAPPTSSSGTTGRRTIVQRSTAVLSSLTYQKQREYRWFRFDPAGRLAYIRFAQDLAPKSDGEFVRDGEAVSQEGWPFVGQYFTTGPHFGFGVTNPVEHRIEFLRALKPDYLMTYPEILEQMTFAVGDERPSESLKGLVSIAEQVTPAMRRRIEKSFAAPLRENYGLNEIGLVAAQCEAGRLHVHTEHCWVEIVDESGVAVGPGEVGRLLVSSLNNRAMPLFRYDTGDLAMAAKSTCPCGRTLPSFENIVGRYSRIAYLTAGTLTLVSILRDKVDSLDASVLSGFRLFQIHQSRDGNFEMRIVSDDPISQRLVQALAHAWKETPLSKGISLRIVRVENLVRSPGGKFQVFTSDFMPAPDEPQTGA